MKKIKIFETRFSKSQVNVWQKFKVLRVLGFLSLLFSYSVLMAADLNADSLINIQQEISGKVLDDQGQPLPGASVVVVGATTGTVTDFDGNYVITASTGSILEFSFIGMETQRVTVTDQTTIDITFEASSSVLDEVVVIGYGTRKKKDLTGAISTITAEELLTEVRMTPELAMQGKMAGVFVSNPGANPNTRPTIRIRGVSTLGFNDPLYVIDGVPITEGLASSSASRDIDIRGSINIMNLINPNDIESISVLKDASATAIYGVRASNGVILIQTKRGRKGKTSVTFSQSFGVQNINKRYDVLNTQEYVDIHNEAWANNTAIGRDDDVNNGFLYDPSSPNYLGDSPTYSWIDDVVNKNAVIQDYNIGISGGSDASNFALGIGYAKQESAVFSTDFERYSFSINSDHQVTKWLKLGQSYRMGLSKTEKEDVSQDEFFRRSILVSPWQPLFDSSSDGFAAPGYDIGGVYKPQGYGNSTRNNFLGRAPYTNNSQTIFRNLGSFYAEITPLKNLRLRGTIGFDSFSNERETLTLQENTLYDAQTGPIPEGSDYRVRRSENLNIVSEFLIGYNNSFGNHNVDVILNAMDQKTYFRISAFREQGGTLTSWEQRHINEGENPLFLERDERGLIGYMGRLSYNFDSKYYIDATARRDGTSVFSPGYKWGTFLAVGMAWRVSSEKFMENSTLFDDLKIRAGWGETGNQETRPYNYLSLINSNPAYALGGGDPQTIYSGASFDDFPIVDTTWETVTTTNVGFDAALLDSRLNVTMEYYSRKTDGILQEIDIPLVIGARTRPVVNLANVENKGIELQIGYNDTFGEVGFNASFNFTTVDNEVTKLYNDKPQGSDFRRIEVGYSLGYIYGYKTDGIFQTQAEVDAWLAENSSPGNTTQLAPGDFRFQDLYGQPTEADGENAYRSEGADNVISVLDKTYLGKTIPGYFYGLSLGADYKGFDLGVTFRGVGDVQKINFAKWAGEGLSTGGANFFTSVSNRWTPTNGSNSFPRAVAEDPSGNNRLSNRWVEDADFFRMQNVQLGYTFKDKIIDKINASNLRIHASISNGFVISSYSGLDPENDTTPTTMTVGFNIGF